MASYVQFLVTFSAVFPYFLKYQFDVRQDMISISLADELVGNHLGNFTTSRLTSEKGI